MADLSGLSDADLNAMASGNMSAVSDAALAHLASSTAQTQPVHNPTEGMSTFQKVAAGFGKSIHDTGLSLEQLGSNVPGLNKLDMFNPKQVQQSIDESKKLDAPLISTGAGLSGNIAGNIGQALLPGGVLKAAGIAAKARGATTLASALSDYGGMALAPKTALQGITTGAAIANMIPVASDESRIVNTLGGAAAGGVVPAIGSAIRTGKAIIEPAYQGGQENILGRLLNRVTGDNSSAVANRLATAQPLVPGSLPTAAEVGDSGGLAALQRAASAANPEDYTMRGLQQSSARLDALRGIAKDQPTLDAAIENRGNAAKSLYGQAFSSDVQRRELDAAQRAAQNPMMLQGHTPPAMPIPALQELSQRPVMKDAIRAATTLAANNGDHIGDPLTSLQGLHYIKLAIDNQLNNGNQNTALASHGFASLNGVKSDLLKAIESSDISPLYGNARKTFADMSQPINQMQVGQSLMDKISPALSDHGALGKETGAKYAQALRNSLQTVKSATGFEQPMENLMLPDQMSTLNAIGQDLARKGNAQELGRGVGSDTFQKLSMGNLADQSGAPLATNAAVGIANAGLGHLPFGLSLLAPKNIYSGKDAIMQKMLSDALLNPSETARLMSGATNNALPSQLGNALRSVTSPLMMSIPAQLNSH